MHHPRCVLTVVAVAIAIVEKLLGSEREMQQLERCLQIELLSHSRLMQLDRPDAAAYPLGNFSLRFSLSQHGQNLSLAARQVLQGVQSLPLPLPGRTPLSVYAHCVADGYP